MYLDTRRSTGDKSKHTCGQQGSFDRGHKEATKKLTTNNTAKERERKLAYLWFYKRRSKSTRSVVESLLENCVLPVVRLRQCSLHIYSRDRVCLGVIVANRAAFLPLAFIVYKFALKCTLTDKSSMSLHAKLHISESQL